MKRFGQLFLVIALALGVLAVPVLALAGSIGSGSSVATSVVRVPQEP